MNYTYYVTIDPTTPGRLIVQDSGGIVVASGDDDPQIITWQLVLPASKPGFFTGFYWDPNHKPPKGVFGPPKLSSSQLELNLPDHNSRRGQGWVYQLVALVDGVPYTTALTSRARPARLPYGPIVYTSGNPTIKNH